MVTIKVYYLEANDESGRYRWWTEAMRECGQFEHADHLDDIESEAQALVNVVLVNNEDEFMGVEEEKETDG